MLPSKYLGCGLEGNGFLSDSSGKRTRFPPHLVSAGEVLWKEPRLAEGRALDAELTHPDVTRSRPKPIPPERQNTDPQPGFSLTGASPS